MISSEGFMELSIPVMDCGVLSEGSAGGRPGGKPGGAPGGGGAWFSSVDCSSFSSMGSRPGGPKMLMSGADGGRADGSMLEMSSQSKVSTLRGGSGSVSGCT